MSTRKIVLNNIMTILYTTSRIKILCEEGHLLCYRHAYKAHHLDLVVLQKRGYCFGLVGFGWTLRVCYTIFHENTEVSNSRGRGINSPPFLLI